MVKITTKRAKVYKIELENGIKIIWKLGGKTKMKQEKTEIDKLLEKLSKHPVNNDKEFLKCLIDLDYRVKKLEKELLSEVGK